MRSPDLAAGREVAVTRRFGEANPSALSEADPADINRWTQGRAIVATGSPFPPVQGPTGPVPVAQANNMLIFPGVGLGALVSRTRRVTDGMFAAASEAVADCVPPERRAQGCILPSVSEIRSVSRSVAMSVALEAVRSGDAPEESPATLEERLRLEMWWPEYMEFVQASD